MNVPTREHHQAPQQRVTTSEEDSDSKSECKPTCTLAQADTHSTWQITLHHNTESDEDDVTPKPQRSEVVIATPQYATITRRAGTDTLYTMLLYHYSLPACSTAVA